MSAALTRTPLAITRALLRKVAAGLAGALLCAQMAIAAYACPALASAAAGETTEADAAPAAPLAQPMANCDDMAGAMDPAAPNLCAEHCKYGQQSDNAATLRVPVALLTALYATPPVPVTAPPPRPAAANLSALVAASPPHAIAHCVYRI
jgi:hypothetical protein